VYTITPTASLKASGAKLVINGNESIPFGIYSISADAKNILLTPAFPGVGAFIYEDTGVRRIPVAGEHYFIVGDKAGTIYRALAGTVFSLPAASYGILNVLEA
jgi:hypothetical protein